MIHLPRCPRVAPGILIANRAIWGPVCLVLGKNAKLQLQVRFMPEIMTQQTTGESQPSSDRPRVVIVGGGITGLSTAHRLGELDPAVKAVVLEASGRAGGVLRTAADQGFLIEESADSFLTAVPDGVNLCRRLGLDEELIPTDPRFRRAFVVCRGKLEPIPDGLLIMAPTRFWPMLATPVLSLRGKLRMGLEYWVPRGSQ